MGSRADQDIPHRISRWSVALTVPLLLLLLPAPAEAQWPPDSLENVQHFPEDMEVRALIREMIGITRALGVHCAYCHVGEEGEPLSTYDVASDEKVTKRKAREMLKMVADINGRHLAALPARSDPPVEVTCATCHSGKARPVTLADELDRVRMEEGGDAAVARYRELRDRFYGSNSYDFLAGTLEGLAVDWAAEGLNVDAIAIVELNLEFYPESARSWYYLGQLHLQEGDRERGLAELERAVELAPGNQRFRQVLEEAREGGGG